MFTLVTGGSGSGKSEWAENYLTSLVPGEKLYIATMLPYDEECRQRIRRHRAQRREKQFSTLECPVDLQTLSPPPDSCILFECLSNLVANELYEENGLCHRLLQERGLHTLTPSASEPDWRRLLSEEITDEVLAEIWKGLQKLKASSRHFILVTNEVFSDLPATDAETQRYVRLLGRLNQLLAKQADEVVEVVYGIPIRHKEALPCHP